MIRRFSKSQIALAVATALSAAAMSTAPGIASAGKSARPQATYVSGDFHNHTTCSDGSISMQKLVKKATDKVDTPWGLDWFVQAGHGGNGNRNCTLAEDATLATPAYPLVHRGRRHDPGPEHDLAEHQPAGATRRAWCRAPRPTRTCGAGSRSRNSSIRCSSTSRAPEQAAVHRRRVGRRRPRAHARCRSSPARCPRRSTAARCRHTPGYTPARQCRRRWRKWEYCFDRGDTDTSRGNTAVGGSDRQQLGLLGPGQR